MRRIVLLLVPLLLAARPQSAQAQLRSSPEADRLFRESAALYAKGDVKEAVAGFERLLRDHPSSQRTTAAMVMKGKGLARLGEHLEAVRTLRTFLSLYPNSSYVPDAYYTLGQVSSRMERDDEALKHYFAAWRSAGIRDTASAVARNAERAFDLTVARSPNLAALEALRPDAVTPRERGFLWLRIGEANAAGTTMGGAATALDTLLLRYPGTVPADRVERLRRRTTERSAVTVGVVLPLMRQAPASALKEVGTEVYDGILFAHEEYQKSGSSRVAITLTVRDTERDPAVAERAAQEVLADPGVVGILGPVFSASTMPVAAIANASGASMVSPTANASGIAATGPFVFQANADYETRARAMARYAVVERGYRLLAVLSPSEASSRQMAEEFKRTAMSLGAQVVATEWYQRGGPDLTKQLTAIRKAGLLAVSDPMISFAGKLNRRDIAKLVSLGVKPKTIDSLVEKAHIVSARWLLGPNARKLIDSMEIAALYASPLLDSLDRPVTALQALYVPIGSPEEIGVITSQLVYYNIRAQVLGSAEWNNLPGLDAHKRYSAGVIFESDGWTDPADSAHAAFVQRYTAARKRKPGKYVLYGYDSARLMFSLIRDGAVTREALRDALARVRDWRGLRSRIGLSGRRVNSWVTILTYDGEAIRPLTEVNMDAPVSDQDRR